MAGLTKRQREALMKNAPTPEDILSNPSYIKELNEEISGSYNQEVAAEEADNDPTLLGVQPFTFEDNMESEQENTTYVASPLVDDDLDADLAKMTKQLERERRVREAAAAKAEGSAPKQEEKTQEELIREQILEMLKKTKGAPNEAGIAKLKQTYGENGVHVVALGEGDIYIFTHLRRGQWKKIQEFVAKAAQTEAFGGKADDMLKEKVLARCVLFPQGIDSEVFLYNSRAGVIDTLFELIMLNSYFLTPQQSLQLSISL
jgi:hypothetical protein